MEVLVMILVLVAGLAALDIASLRWGVDTRPRMTDDHIR